MYMIEMWRKIMFDYYLMIRNYDVSNRSYKSFNFFFIEYGMKK